jgi:hypothetical protein
MVPDKLKAGTPNLGVHAFITPGPRGNNQNTYLPIKGVTIIPNIINIIANILKKSFGLVVENLFLMDSYLLL